jgi:glycosyltransferase involved in cell wall biosynthesis
MVASYYPPHLGGLEVVAKQLAEALARRGHDLQVLSTDCGAPTLRGTRDEAGVAVTRCGAVDVAHTPLSLSLASRLVRLPGDRLVHAHIGQAFLPEMVWASARLRRRPYVVHYHLDIEASGRFGFLLPAYKRTVFTAAMRGAAAVIVLSQQQADFVSEVHGVRAERVHVVPNGVTDDFLRLGQQRADEPARTTGEATRLVFVGRLAVQKNVPRLLGALSRVSAPVELTIVGDGELREELTALAHRLGVPARFVGRLSGQPLLDELAKGEVFVSSSDKEGMPLSLMEAMAAGLPVVSTDVGGSRELVGEAGLLVEPGEAALAAGIDLLCTDPDLRHRLARAGHERAQQFTWDQAAQRVEAVYATMR